MNKSEPISNLTQYKSILDNIKENCQILLLQIYCILYYDIL